MSTGTIRRRLMGSGSSGHQLPPLWLSCAALTAAITAGFGIQRWIDHFVNAPYAEDFRLGYVAAEIGLSRGWSHIYDLDLQRQLAAGFGPVAVITPDHNNVTPPILAWLMAPLTLFPLQTGYLIWTLVSLAALVAAWWLVCPGKGLARVTLLLIAIALYPMHYTFWLGQSGTLSIAGLALTWWFLMRERWGAAGAVLAVTMFLKPQVLLLLPVALLITGRWKPVLCCALVGAVLAVITVVSLGLYGIDAWSRSIAYTAPSPIHTAVTFAYLFGRGPVATAVEVALAAIALALAWYRRDRLDLVFALGIVGTTASAFYFHEYEPAVLILPAWIVLGSRPSVPQRVWLLLGIAAAQFIALGLPIPMLVWEAGWIGWLGLEPWLARRELPLRAAAPQLLGADSGRTPVQPREFSGAGAGTRTPDHSV
ncbi:MAG TPA: glycosyltransferase family 87 protein [Candidatus Dormibacteraeota bacterium]|nr:glycosyltransferase family 87 protein [Candidatus Dormibacteraeota bacterium]